MGSRFPLLRNLGDAVTRVLQRHADELQRVPGPALPPASPPADQAPAAAPATGARPERPHRRASRERTRQAMRERYEAVQQVAAWGMMTSAIARALRLPRHTVQQSRPLPAPPERRHGWRFPSLLAPYEGYLLERWRQGGHTAMTLWRELGQRGFPGQYRTVARLVAHWQALARTGAPVHRGAGATTASGTAAAAGDCPAALAPAPPDHASTMRRRADAHRASRGPYRRGPARPLLDRFAGLRRQAPPTTTKAGEARLARLARLARWTADAARSGLSEVEAFTTKLRQDRTAVQAALTLPYSQGQTEGQITRLKALKRHRFGRANFDLLRKRFLLSATTAAPP